MPHGTIRIDDDDNDDDSDDDDDDDMLSKSHICILFYHDSHSL